MDAHYPGSELKFREAINKTTEKPLSHLLLTHIHGDHVFGLFGLLSSLGMMGRKVPLHIYGPQDLGNYLDHYSKFFGPLPFELDFTFPEDSIACIFENEKLTVEAIPLKHRVPAYGYLFREKKKALNVRKEQIEAFGLGIADLVKIKQGGDFVKESGEVVPNSHLTLPPFHQRSYAYLSDTRFDMEFASIVKGVDLLFHEATFLERDKKLAAQTQHSTAAEAAELAKAAGAKKLLIGHFSSRYKDPLLFEQEARKIFKNTSAVNDGDIYSIAPERLSRE